MTLNWLDGFLNLKEAKVEAFLLWIVQEQELPVWRDALTAVAEKTST